MSYNMKIYNQAVAMFNNLTFGERLNDVPYDWWQYTQQEKYYFLYQKLMKESLEKLCAINQL